MSRIGRLCRGTLRFRSLAAIGLAGMARVLIRAESGTAPSGLRAKAWPDGNQVATPRPAVVHHETDTFTTTYTAIDPLRPDHAAVTLDGFFGWPLTAVAS